MKSIEFYPASKDAEIIIPPPKPASNYIPQWYKDEKIFQGGAPKFSDGEILNKTIKSCAPFFDAYNTGYIQETWCDIHFSFSENYFNFSYAFGPSPLSSRDEVNIKIQNSFRPLELIWKVYWVPKLEKGYSAMITHPLNRYELPFLTATGIIDSDNFYHTFPGNYPFYLYKNFEGIIPAGTPMYQIIPVKRDSWKSSAETFIEEDYLKRLSYAKKFFIGGYKKLFHEKKYYK
jgi:hypothetical protein